MQSQLEKLPQARTKVTVILDSTERTTAEEKALQTLSQSMKLPGFRPGKAPLAVLREKVTETQLLEETVRAALPDVMKTAMATGELRPIMQPSVSLEAKEPLTLSVMFVERPEVKVKGAKKLSIQKNPITDPTAKEVDECITQLLDRDRKETSVDRAAKTGDVVEVAMDSKDEKGEPLKELTVSKYSVVLGKEELLPELEKHMHDVKKGESKTTEIAFAKDHDIPALQGKKATVTLTVNDVREVTLPELTPEYIKTRLGAEKSVEEFRKDVSVMLRSQRGQQEMQRREQELLKTVRESTTVDLAPELLNAEARLVLDEFQARLQKQGITFDDWIQSTGKEQKEVEKEVLQSARDRLLLRFGMHKVVEEREIPASDTDVVAFLQEVSGPDAAKEHVPGSPAFEEAKAEVKVRTFIEEMVKE